MVVAFAVQRSDDAHLICMLGKLWILIRNFDARFAALGKGKRTLHGIRLCLAHKRVFFAEDRDLLAVPFVEFGFGIEQVNMAGTTVHEQENDLLRTGRKMSGARTKRGVFVPSQQPVVGQHPRQRQTAKSASGSCK